LRKPGNRIAAKPLAVSRIGLCYTSYAFESARRTLSFAPLGEQPIPAKNGKISAPKALSQFSLTATHTELYSAPQVPRVEYVAVLDGIVFAASETGLHQEILRSMCLKVFGLIVIVLLTVGGVSAFAQDTTTADETLTLDQAIAIAQANNRQIKIAKQGELSANDQILAGRTQRLPQFNVQLTGGGLLSTVGVNYPAGTFGTVNGVPVPTTDKTLSTGPGVTGMAIVQAYQPLSQLYDIHLNIEALKVGKKLAEEQTRQQRQQVVNSVKDVYYSLLQTQSALDAAEDNVKSLREIDRTTDVYLVQKTVLVYQSSGIKAQLAQAEVQVLTLQDTLDSQKENFNVLLARDVRTKFRPAALPEELPEEQDLEAARQKAIDNRTEVRQAKLKFDQAVFSRRIEKAQYIPQIGIQYLFFSPFAIQGLPQSINTIGVNLKWDLYDWGYKKHLMDQKQRAVEQSSLSLTETQSQVAVDLGSKFRKLREARANVKVAQMAQQAEREKLQMVMDQYKQKAALLTNVLTEQTNMSQTNAQYNQSVAAFWTARSDFEKSLGAD
jgi:outer membrane protein TolC